MTCDSPQYKISVIKKNINEVRFTDDMTFPRVLIAEQKSRSSMTIQQNKIILYLISKIKPEDTGKENYIISIPEFCEVCKISYENGKNQTDIKKSSQNTC